MTTKTFLRPLFGVLICLFCRCAVAQEWRDPWLWPFDQHSIWNTPIGSKAVYVDVDLVPTKGAGTDVRHFLQLERSDPERQVIGFKGFAPKEGRCAGKEDMNGMTIHIPDDWIVPDIGRGNPYGLTPNSGFCFRWYGEDRCWSGPAIARCRQGGPLYMSSFMKYPNNQKIEDLRGDGVTNAAGQGASGMSGLGGTIRLGELTGGRPLRHAIKINPWGHHLFYSQERPGYRWPARSADRYANTPGAKNRYVGKNPSLLMGSLLAIKSEVTAEQLGLTTEPGKQLLFVLQNYGAYISEDAGWDVLDLVVERGVGVEFEEKYGYSLKGDRWESEMLKLARVLKVVDNNSPKTIGGGGEPLQPPAPGFR